MESELRRSVAGAWGLDTGPVAMSRGESIADWWRRLERAPRSVLMLDFDGTVAPFVRERMQAKMYPGVAERLYPLAASPRTRLVVVSGRPAGDFAALLPSDLHVEIWGSHGRERVTADGVYNAWPLTAAQQKGLDQLEADMRTRGLGSVVEKKMGSLAVHTRGFADSDAERIVMLVRDFYATLITQRSGHAELELLPFDGGLELRGIGRSKATAVASILSEEPAGSPAAYLGDDLTDEEAFAALGARVSDGASLGVLVRTQPRPSAANLWLAPPEELLAFLDRWQAAVSRALTPSEGTR